MQSKQSEVCQEYNKKTKQNCKETKKFYLYHLIGSYLCLDIITSNTVHCWARIYTLINFNVRVVVFKLLLILFHNIPRFNRIASQKFSFFYLFNQRISFEYFPLRNFASINDVNKLVSSISSALSYLVRKLQ